MPYNQDAWRLVEAKVKEEAATAGAAAVTEALAGSGGDLPTSAAKIGQLFVKTGASNPGLYISTGTTTPGWTLVANKNAE